MPSLSVTIITPSMALIKCIAVVLIKYTAVVSLPLKRIFQVSTCTKVQKHDKRRIINTFNFSIEFLFFKLN